MLPRHSGVGHWLQPPYGPNYSSVKPCLHANTLPLPQYPDVMLPKGVQVQSWGPSLEALFVFLFFFLGRKIFYFSNL